MWDLLACRSCLATNTKLEKVTEPLRRLFEVITGLQFQTADGYPNYLCSECHMQIKKALAFRRRSRRAFYVTMEIMNVRKRVTLADILIVDRIKTNLKSSLEFTLIGNNKYYTINADSDSTEGTTGLQLRDYNKPFDNDSVSAKKLRVYTRKVYNHEIVIEPPTLSKAIFHIDIKPDGYDEEKYLEELKLEDRKQEIEDIVASINNDDDAGGANDDVNGNDDMPEGIDLEDVFKDLKEEKISDDDDLSSLDWEIPKKKKALEKKKKKKLEKKEKKEKGEEVLSILEENHLITNLGLDVVVDMLCNAELRFMPLEEQKEKFQLRLQSKHFVSATYKCAMCVKEFPTIDFLKTHVDEHNVVKGKFVCGVCQNRFSLPDTLLIHFGESHFYEYTCKSCNEVLYSLEDFINHNLDSEKVEVGCRETTDHAKLIRKHFMVTPLSQTEMETAMKGTKSEGVKCLLCSLTFPNKMSLLHHMPMHETMFDLEHNKKCDLCKISTTKELLEEHILRWHCYKYKCKICGDTFMHRPHAQKHYEKKHLKLTCCRLRFKNSYGYQLHVRMKHNKIKTMHCNHCGYATGTKHALYTHQLRTHLYISIPDPRMGREEFACLECNVYFVSQKSYNNHILKMGHEGAENIEFGCMKCKKLFDCKEEYDGHFENSCTMYPRKCGYCDEFLQTHTEYRKHHSVAHPDLPYLYPDSIMCEICGTLLNRASSKSDAIKAHQAVCKGDKISYRRLQCEYCGIYRMSNIDLAWHILSSHTRRPYHCGLCGTRFKARLDCKDHILKVHTPVKLFKCKHCTESFYHFDYLSQHAQSEHNITMIKPRPKFKERTRLYVYPHMKIDASLFDKEFLFKNEIVLCDYFDDKFKPLKDPSDYFTFDEFYNSKDNYRNTVKSRQKKKKNQVKKKTADDDKTEPYIEEKMDIDNIEDVIERVKSDFSKEFLECEMKLNVVEGLQVVEEEGQQYIIVNDMLYKVAMCLDN